MVIRRVRDTKDCRSGMRRQAQARNPSCRTSAAVTMISVAPKIEFPKANQR